jgi:probable phosphoglycerate mutase
MARQQDSNPNAEEMLSLILALPKAERARLFDMMARESALARYMMPPRSRQLSFETSNDFDGAPDYVVVFDGGSEGNPGFGYGSYAVIARDGRQRVRRLDFGDDMTNNEAEYDTLIAALEDISERVEAVGKRPSDFTIEVRGDSNLVLRQVRGEWKAKNERMRHRRDIVRSLLSRFGGYRLVEQPREESVKVLGH